MAGKVVESLMHGKLEVILSLSDCTDAIDKLRMPGKVSLPGAAEPRGRK